MVADRTVRRVGIAVAALVLLVGVLAVAVVVAYDQPRVTTVENEFGAVTEETADVHTRVVVENPNRRPIPGAVAFQYTVGLNDVTVATGTEEDIRVGPGETVIETTATFDNSRVPAWWVSHVNNGEHTTMTTQARVGIAGLPVGPRLDAQRQEITTDLLGPLADDAPATVRLGETDILVISDQRAAWGTADAASTPVHFTTRLENVHERPVRLDGTDYEVRMNGIVVGRGETTDGVLLAPGEATDFTVEAVIDTPVMQSWWASHLREDESTDLRIEVWGVVEADGERKQLPLTVFDRQATFETDLLGTGETQVSLVEAAAEADPGFTEPQVGATESAWGAVGDDETEIVTDVEIANENDAAFTDLLSLDVHQRTTIGGVVVADEETRIDSLPHGNGTVRTSASKAHATVPEWWAAHLRDGERSTVVTELDAEADVAVTTIPVALEDRESIVETDLLADLNDDSTRYVRSETGRTVLVVHATTARWEDPTPQAGPIVVEAELENTEFSPVTIREIDYLVEINGVTLADERSPEEYTIGPRERETIELRLVLDNSQMEAWWPTHVRNDEVSNLSRTVEATVESGSRTDRVELAFLSEDVRVETDLLGLES